MVGRIVILLIFLFSRMIPVLALPNQSLITSEFVKVKGLSEGIQSKRILPKKVVNGVITLTQSMITAPNTTYIIKYDFVLSEDIIIPDNCELKFYGGSIRGKKVCFNNTLLTGEYKIYCGISGTINNKKLNYKGFTGCNLIELCAAIRGCTLNLKGYSFDLKEDLVINSGTKIVGGVIRTTAYIKNEGGYTSNPFGANRRDLKRELAKDAQKGTKVLKLVSVEGLAVGDYIKIGNGYGSLWNILENEKANGNWIFMDKTGWDYQISVITSISDTSITIQDNLMCDYPVKTVATGLIDNESLNKAFVSKIGQVKNITLEGCVIEGELWFNCCDNLVVENCVLKSSAKKTLVLGTCINSKILNNEISASGVAISLESQTYNTIVKGNTCSSKGTYDSCILTMLGVSKCTISNNTVLQDNNEKIGIYLNTSKDNYVTNNVIKDCYEAVRSGYSFGGAVVKENVAYNCSVYWINNARDDSFIDNKIINYRFSESVANGLNIYSSKNIEVDGLMTDVSRENSIISGVKDCRISNCRLNSLLINKPDPNIDYDFNKSTAFEISDCTFNRVSISDGDERLQSGLQEKIFRRCQFTKYQSVIGESSFSHNNKFFNCSFKSDNATALSVRYGSNTLENCVFDGKDYDLYIKEGKRSGHSGVSDKDFRGSRFVHNRINRQ